MDRQQRVSENMGLVHSCAQRFKGRGMEYDDLFQAGCIGLLKAADHFDESRGLQFSTYAVPVILGEMRQLFRSGGVVKVGRSLKELSMKAARESQRFAEQEGRSPTVSELARALGVEPEQAAQALNASLAPLSLTAPEEEGGGQLDVSVEGEDERVTELISLKQVVGELEPNDQKIIALRYFQSRTQVETASRLGMTQVQVSRREKRILRELRQKLIV